jgi:hypothetical protein
VLTIAILAYRLTFKPRRISGTIASVSIALATLTFATLATIDLSIGRR